MLIFSFFQHYLETYENLYRLRDILYERYRILLNEKVQKQRIQLKMCNLRVQEHKKHNEKKVGRKGILKPQSHSHGMGNCFYKVF